MNNKYLILFIYIIFLYFYKSNFIEIKFYNLLANIIINYLFNIANNYYQNKNTIILQIIYYYIFIKLFTINFYNINNINNIMLYIFNLILLNNINIFLLN